MTLREWAIFNAPWVTLAKWLAVPHLQFTKWQMDFISGREPSANSQQREGFDVRTSRQPRLLERNRR